MISPLRIVVVVCALAAVSIPARADRAAVVAGGGKGKELAPLVAAAREILEQERWIAVDYVLAAERATELLDCFDDGDRRDECVKLVAEESGAERVLTLRLGSQKHGKETVRIVTGSILRRGEVLAFGERFCERCSAALLRDHVRELVTDLVGKAKAKLAPATLIVRARPAGARICIDGTAVGIDEVENRVRAGTHVVEVELEGYESATLEISVGDGERRDLDVTLEPSKGSRDTVIVDPPPPDDVPDPPPTRTPRPRRSNLVPWLVIGAGAVVAAGGGVLWAMDEDDIGDDGHRIRTYKDTTLPGVAALTTGAVAVVVGVWLLRSGPAAPPESSAVAPLVDLTQGGAVLGAQGRF